jgi:hypothetical protein
VPFCRFRFGFMHTSSSNYFREVSTKPGQSQQATAIRELLTASAKGSAGGRWPSREPQLSAISRQAVACSL